MNELTIVESTSHILMYVANVCWYQDNIPNIMTFFACFYAFLRWSCVNNIGNLYHIMQDCFYDSCFFSDACVIVYVVSFSCSLSLSSMNLYLAQCRSIKSLYLVHFNSCVLKFTTICGGISKVNLFLCLSDI